MIGTSCRNLRTGIHDSEWPQANRGDLGWEQNESLKILNDVIFIRYEPEVPKV